MISWWAELPSLLAWTLHWAICVTIVSAVGVFAVRLVRRHSAYIRHTVACSIFCLLVVLPAITAAYHWNILGASGASGIYVATLPTTASIDTMPTAPDAPDTPSESSAHVAHSVAVNLRYWLAVVVCSIWFTGTLVRGSNFLAVLRRRRAFAMTWESITDPNVLRLLETLQSKLGMRRVVSLTTSSLAPAPFTVGVVKPTIVLPTSLTHTKNLDEMESVLVHELAHVQRSDYAVSMLSTLMEHLYWWNPFLSEIRDELVAAREVICDHTVLIHTGDGETLANYLFVSLEQLANERFVWGVGMSIDPKTVELRINQLMSGDNEMKTQSQYVRGVILCFSIVICIACVHVNYANAQFVLGTPVNFGSVVNSDANEGNPALTPDGKTLYFHSNRLDGKGGADIWFATRDDIGSDWNAPQNFDAINTAANDLSPFVTDDGRTFLYNDGLVENQPATIYRLTRDSDMGTWGPPSAFPAPINDGVSNSSGAFMSADGNTLLFHSDRKDGDMNDLFEATWSSDSEAWTVRNLGPNVNSPLRDINPIMSSDGRTLLFGSERADGQGGFDIWMSQRSEVGADWEPAMNLGATVNTPGNETPGQLWETQNLLLFRSGAAGALPGQGGADLFYVKVVPEPTTSGMAISGLFVVAGLLGNRRRHRHS